MKLSCKKCGHESTPDDKYQKFCIDCGTAYDFVIGPNVFEIQKSPLYLKILELNNRWVDGGYASQEADLISQASINAMFYLKDRFLDSLKDDFFDNEEILGHISKLEGPIGYIFLSFINNGYFTWIAEQVLNNDSILTSKAPNTESFGMECIKNHGFLYKDFTNSIMGFSKDTEFFSQKSASVINVFVIMQWSTMSNKIGIIPLKDIYDQIQSICTEAMISGYAVAFTDAKYRI